MKGDRVVLTGEVVGLRKSFSGETMATVHVDAKVNGQPLNLVITDIGTQPGWEIGGMVGVELSQ